MEIPAADCCLESPADFPPSIRSPTAVSNRRMVGGSYERFALLERATKLFAPEHERLLRDWLLICDRGKRRLVKLGKAHGRCFSRPANRLEQLFVKNTGDTF